MSRVVLDVTVPCKNNSRFLCHYSNQLLSRALRHLGTILRENGAEQIILAPMILWYNELQSPNAVNFPVSMFYHSTKDDGQRRQHVFLVQTDALG